MCPMLISKETQDKVKLAKKYIEDKYQSLILQERQQKENWNKIVDLMTHKNIPASQKKSIQKEIRIQQDIKKRLMRQKDSLKNYQLYNLIGMGAFGEVRLAKNRQTNQIVAIKRIEKLKLVEKKQISSAYLQKQLMIKNCDSKFLVKLHSTFQDRKYIYLVMEYVSGGDLLHLLIQQDIFSEEHTKFYIAELIVAIQQIHNRNFIHRDIKPDNVLIDASGHIKISDFGLSKYMRNDAFRRETLQFARKSDNKSLRQSYKSSKKGPQKLSKINFVQQRTVKSFSKVGTPDYISPEVLTADEYDYSIDIWSVGVIMFECLFGYPPFSDQDPKLVCQKVVNWIQYLEFPEGFNVSIEAKLLMLGMISERQKRLSINQIKQHPFFFGIDWNNILKLKPPMIPKLQHQLDTKHFEKYDQQSKWVDEDETNPDLSSKKQQFKSHSPASKNINFIKKRSSSADYLFAGFQYRNISIEPFKFVENQINNYQKKQAKIQSSKKIFCKSPQLTKKSTKRFLTEDETKQKDKVKIVEQKNSSKYYVKLPQSPKSILQKFNLTTNSLLQFSKSSSKFGKEMSFMKENQKEKIRKCSKMSSVKKITSCQKIGSKRII